MERKNGNEKSYSAKHYEKNGKLHKKGKKYNSNAHKEEDLSFKARVLRKKDFQKLTRDIQKMCCN